MNLLNAKAAELGPSMMCADPGNLRAALLELDSAGVDYFHFDVMDGHFVQNFALSPDVIRALRPATTKRFDVHLMMHVPERYLECFVDSGADSITVHLEAAGARASTLVEDIRRRGCFAGVAISPKTPVSALASVIRDVDLVCLMAVEPGFAGQAFIASTLPRLDELAELIAVTGASAKIQIDGSVSLDRLAELQRRGASSFVGGTSLLFRPGSTLAREVGRARSLLAGSPR